VLDQHAELDFYSFYIFSGGLRGRDRMVVGFTTTYAVTITTDVVSLYLDQGEVYNIM
jgi:hypothetical protein